MSDDSSNGLVWFLAGLGVGATLGLLYAPKAGRELREDIRGSAGSGRDYAAERAQRVREQAGEWVDRGREVLNQQKEQFKSAFDAGRQAYRDVTSEG
jgi:gas vesicle protein